MDFLGNIFWLILGLAAIVKSADVLIDASAQIARRFGVSSFVIGITVIAFGTSAPELSVGIVSGISRTNELTLGNIIGSALANVALIVGICAARRPLVTKKSVLRREFPMLLGIELVLCAMLLNGVLSRLEGALLLAGFAAFIACIALDAKKTMALQDAAADTKNDEQSGMAKLLLFSALSLAGLFLGGKLTVDSSSAVAQRLGLSETLIGLTVVALATTLPELITSLTAVRKNEPDIVLGNCIGSNIFNILFVLGTSSVIHPITLRGSLWAELAAMLTLTTLLFLLALVQKKIHRAAGILLILCFAAYLVYQVVGALV